MQKNQKIDKRSTTELDSTQRMKEGQNGIHKRCENADAKMQTPQNCRTKLQAELESEPECIQRNTKMEL